MWRLITYEGSMSVSGPNISLEMLVRAIADEIAQRVDEGEDARLIAEKVVKIVEKFEKLVETRPLELR